MKGMLIRVGIDTGAGGTLGPIFDDGTFEFIPIPEDPPSKDDPRWLKYRELPARSRGVLADYLPEGLQGKTPHADPEFETPSYGDPTTKKNILKKLGNGDLLFFHAGLQPWNTTRYPERANYIIGYFTVDRVVDFCDYKIDSKEFTEEWKRLHKNFHVGYREEHCAFVVVGDKKQSHLLTRAFPFTEIRPDKAGRKTVAIRKDLEDSLGLSGFVQRSIPRLLPEKGVKYLLASLDSYV